MRRPPGLQSGAPKGESLWANSSHCPDLRDCQAKYAPPSSVGNTLGSLWTSGALDSTTPPAPHARSPELVRRWASMSHEVALWTATQTTWQPPKPSGTWRRASDPFGVTSKAGSAHCPSEDWGVSTEVAAASRAHKASADARPCNERSRDEPLRLPRRSLAVTRPLGIFTIPVWGRRPDRARNSC